MIGGGEMCSFGCGKKFHRSAKHEAVILQYMIENQFIEPKSSSRTMGFASKASRTFIFWLSIL
jgi:hypothetical protein